MRTTRHADGEQHRGGEQPDEAGEALGDAAARPLAAGALRRSARGAAAARARSARRGRPFARRRSSPSGCSSRSLASSRIDRGDAPRADRTASTLDERLVEQEDVERDDQRRHDRGDHRRERRLTSAPMTSARRVSRIIGTSANGMPNDSTTWEITSVVGRVDADREHDERGRHRDRAAQEERDAAVDEALHHDLAGVRADARARQAGGEQRDREGERRAAAEQRARSRRGRPRSSRRRCRPLSWKSCGGDDEHRQVDDARRGPSRCTTSSALEAQQLAPLVVVLAARIRRWVSAECR